MTLGKMIREARLRLGISQEALALRVGVTKGAVSQWETGTGFPSRANARALAKELGINVKELEARLSSGLNLLDALPAGRDIPLMRWDQLKKLHQSPQRGKRKGPPNGPTSGDAMLSVDADMPQDAIAANIVDDSMVPYYAPGDCIIFAKSIPPRHNDDVVAIVDDEHVMLRRYVPRGLNRQGVEVFDLQSTSPDYETITAHTSRKVSLLGTVVEHRRKRRP